MPTEFIRQFEPADAEGCSRLIRACLVHDPLVPQPSRQTILLSETPELMLERARNFYIAVYASDEVIAGLGGVDLNEIRLLFVAPGRRNRGIGSALLSHLESWIPSALFRDAFVYAAPGAVTFYRANGYVPKGEHIFPSGDVSVPTVFMTKSFSKT